MIRIPMHHRINSIKPIVEGILLLTDILKSFIQFAVTDWFVGAVSLIISPMGDEDAFFKFMRKFAGSGLAEPD